jgi:hypothetical protein
MKSTNRSWRSAPRSKQLVFSPLAWLKLQWCCHAGDTEVGGFGITVDDDPLYVEEFITVCQRTTPVTVQFDDMAVADYFDACVDAGLKPDRFARVWIHTHPGSSAVPSHTDEETFDRRFGTCDWAVMSIVSRTAKTYARLALRTGPGARIELPVAVDWADWPKVATTSSAVAALIEQWKHEFMCNVQPMPWPLPKEADDAAAQKKAKNDWWEAVPATKELDEVFYQPIF